MRSIQTIVVQRDAAPPAAVVSATDVRRRYGDGETAVDALRGVSLEVARGQLTAVMGPSGSGKSTLMRILAKTGLGGRRKHRPAVVFADDPTGNLDSTTGAEILELLRDSVSAFGQTTVMATNDAHAAAIADRVLFLADGRIVKDVGPSTAHQILEAMEEVSGR